jgi:hypothetical protein
MRLLLLLLLLANLGFFAYHRYLGDTDDAAAQIAALQISPETIRPVAALAPGSAPAAAAPATSAACVEWGPFGGSDVARADAALAALSLPVDALQRQMNDVDGYWVHMPAAKTKAEVDRKVGELKALGVTELFVVQDAGPWRNAISLGLFKSEDAAIAELERLRQLGVRSALITRREKLLKLVSFFVREPSAVTIARITELQGEFPGASMHAVNCPAGQPPAQ